MPELMCLEEVETDSAADNKVITIVTMSEQKTINHVLPGTPSDDPHQRPGCSTPAAAETKPRALKSRFSNQIKRNLTKPVRPIPPTELSI